MASSSSGRMYVLTAGFGATVAMSFVGYLGHIPPLVVPGPVLLFLMLGCLFGAGIELDDILRFRCVDH